MSEQLIKTPGVFGDNENFLLERELGTGGMGGVYMGRDKMLDRPVAVKVMLPEYGSDPEFVNKFKKEAQSAARLLHPNIAQVYSYGICQGMPYIAMELASGGSLYSLMQAHPGKIDIQRTLKLCQQTAQALQCATDQGVVHGDVKPENILLDANGNAKLVDFGLAAMQKDTNEIWGTPYYISPERVKKEPVDYRADMYSLGGTLYHALTGVAPFEGDDAIAVVKKRFEGMPKKPSEIRPEITPAIDNLVMTMLALNKEDRYPSFEALLEAFKETLTSGLTQKLPSTGSVKPKTGTTSTKRLTVKGRKMTLKKPGVTAEGEDKPVENPGEKTGNDAATKPTDQDEESGGNIAKKMILGLVAGILAIGAIAGFLVWYVHHDKAVKEAERHQQIVQGCRKARQAVEEHKAKAEKFDAEFKEFAARATTECEKFTAELAKLLPDYADQIKPTENAAATTNELPIAVTEMRELWERALSCQTSQQNVSAAAQKVMEECAKSAAFAEDTEANVEKLSAITQTAKELYDQMMASKDVENVKKGITFIKSKGDKTIKQTVRRLTIEKAEKDREDQKRKADEAEAQRKLDMEAAKKALIEKETSEIASKFDAIALQGCFRQLDWASAMRQLKDTSELFESEEGRQAAAFQMKKVEQMKKVQDIFIDKLSGYTFKGKLKGAKVTKVDAKELQMVREKKPIKISWQKFYKDYPGNFNEIINVYIVKGRQNSGLNLMGWKDAMTGAALTMRLVCSEIQGATGKAEMLAKEVVKQAPDFQKIMQDVFPDISFEGLEQD